MFKSIFTKYIATFMLIIFGSFVVLASIISGMIIRYYTDSNDRLIASSAESLKYLIEERMNDLPDGTLTDYVIGYTDEVEDYFSALTKYGSDTALFITDEEGKILASVGFSLSDFGKEPLPPSVMDAIREGEFTEESDLTGILSGKMSVKGVPLVNVEGTMIGSVFACSTAENIDILMETTVKAILTTCLWVLLAALIAAYILSDRLVGPLKHMAKAAKSFAAGKFDARVPVKGHDELAELGVAFNNMAASLADLENMRSTFLSNVSHDLRTPMTTISGFIDALLDGTIPVEKQEYYLRIIGDEVRRLSRLVAALLDVSRIQAGDRKFVMTAFDICEMARVILISFEQKIDQKRLDVEFDVEAENLYVWADHDAIYQILYNICDNAVKFSREGGKYRIRILEKDRKIFVSVMNEGDGIKSEELPHVFDRFYKTDKSRGLDKTGVGLGLYIAKSIIDAHSEEIWVQSKFGEYCEFIFTLQKATDTQIKKSFEKQMEEPKRLGK